MIKLVVLISGQGSNLQAIIDAITQQQLDASIELVISNRPAAMGLTRAKQAGIDTLVLDHKLYATAAAYDAALLPYLTQHSPDLIVLAGFMRILGPTLIQQFPGRIVNIHPSLLPKFPGLHTYQQVLAAKETEHGITIHFVTETVDAGPIIAQSSFPIHSDQETVETLKSRTHALEHQLYPQILQWYAQGQFDWCQNAVVWRNNRKSLYYPIQ
ncbi:MAG: phosphoribosylglycinamide formyltransferase [Legionellales bacterium]|nr:phosphoribosylglycinamide formyltransferase [Legionellales bacterium]